MKNVVFFVVLAILTVAALVGWNAIRQQSSSLNETAQQTEPTPTLEIGTAVGRQNDFGSVSGQSATGSAGFGTTTKGGFESNTPTATSAGTVMAVISQAPVRIVPTSTTHAANVVTFTDNGFTPKTLTVKTGTMVKFLNQSNKRMWVESADVSGGKKLEQFNMGVSVGRDGFYEFQFTSNGTWGFFDHNSQHLTGSIVVN